MDTKKLRQKILDLAIHGMLVPQDPNDEPASVLLERIRAEKEALIKEGKIKRNKKSAASDTSHYENVPFEVPEGWCWCKLEDIVYITNGSTLDKSEELTSGEIPYIKVGDMNMPGNEIEILSSKAYLNDVKTVISIPSIIFPKRGGAILTNKKRKVINQPIWIDLNIMAVTAIDNNTFDYIWAWFSQLDLSTLCNGGNIPQINTPDIANLLFPLPPIKEQKNR